MRYYLLPALLLFIALSANGQSPIPTLQWGTYFGGSGNENSRSIAKDGAGNIYMAGSTTSATGVATKGAYQPTLVGLTDAFLAKFNTAGNLLWATYFGAGSETALGVATDNAGNVYMTGSTGSKSGIATAGAFDTVYTDHEEAAFIAKFDSSGSLQWATYVGGNYFDQPYGVATDAAGNVYIAGYTYSDSGVATPGAHDTVYGGNGLEDAFLAKYNSAGVRQWSTYYGGSKNDQAFSVAVDEYGYVYMCGSSYSGSGIATPGAHKTIGDTIQGDAFLAKFDSTGTLVWGTYYGGTGGENAYSVTTDDSDNIYVTGYSSSHNGIATPGAYQTTFGGNNDMFVSKFSNAGVLLWGTYYGGSIGGEGLGVTTDTLGDVYITGNTFSNNGVATPGAYQTTGDSINGNGFLAKFNSAGALKNATYYGGSAYDIAYGTVVDDSGNVYITGGTVSQTNMSTQYAYQYYFGGGGNNTYAITGDAFLAKFNFVCSYSFSLDTFICPSPADTTYDSICSIITQGGCDWFIAVTSGNYWLSISSATTATGNGPVSIKALENTSGYARTGTISLYGQTLTVIQPSICTYRLSFDTFTCASNLANTYSNVTELITQAYCGWSASVTSGNSWLSISSVDTLNKSISISVLQNSSDSTRTGTIDLGGQTFTVIQPDTTPCSYTLSSPGNVLPNAFAGTYKDLSAVITDSACAWTATVTSGNDWLSTNSSSAMGDSVTITVQENISVNDRFASIEIANQEMDVIQPGATGCYYALYPDTFYCPSSAYASYYGATDVFTPDGCNWTAVVTSGEDWLSTSASGDQETEMEITVQQNLTDSTRVGTINVEGQILTVIQPANDLTCTYIISPNVYTCPNYMANTYNRISYVATSGACNWTATVTSGADWLSTLSGSAGNDSISITVLQNSTGSARIGTIDVAGSTLTIFQPLDPTPCVYHLSKSSYTCPSSSANTYSNISMVTTQSWCPWTAAVTLGNTWLSTTSTGIGNGNISITVQQNTTDSPRIGIISFDSVALTIIQPGVCTYSLSPDTFICPSSYAGNYPDIGSASTQTDCHWVAEAIIGSDWLSTSSTGTGDGTIGITVQQNLTDTTRTGVINIGGQSMYIIQPTLTGIANVSATSGAITVYPNPSTGEFYFKGIRPGSALQVYDVLGQNILSTIISSSGGGKPATPQAWGEENYLLNISGYAKGVYFYRVVVNGHAAAQSGKIVLE